MTDAVPRKPHPAISRPVRPCRRLVKAIYARLKVEALTVPTGAGVLLVAVAHLVAEPRARPVDGRHLQPTAEAGRGCALGDGGLVS